MVAFFFCSTKEFLTLEKSRIKTKAGRYGGTYGDELAILHYASWISAEFHAAVLKAFQALAHNNDTVDIRVDKEGRVNLNDIRQASPLNGTRKKEISQWLGAAKTKKLINSLQSTTQICVVLSVSVPVFGCKLPNY
ncbi:TPA: KilA-N domain-containing protein [Salmonella enterica subsp. enterica serovar Infantis]|nr:KilA-N domain-containing protein [Salmonella enterica subsp. enterica serovar Infantis]